MNLSDPFRSYDLLLKSKILDVLGSLTPIDVKERLRRRNSKRKHPKEYHKKVLKADGSCGWQGGRDLSSSAAYTAAFCQAVMKCWLEKVGPNAQMFPLPDGMPNV